MFLVIPPVGWSVYDVPYTQPFINLVEDEIQCHDGVPVFRDGQILLFRFRTKPETTVRNVNSRLYRTMDETDKFLGMSHRPLNLI